MKRTMLFAASALMLAACGQGAQQKSETEGAAAPPTPAATGVQLPPARKIPADAGPALPEPAPGAPAWAAAHMGKQLSQTFDQTSACIGNIDKVRQRYAGAPAGVQLVGWGWNTAAKARIDQVLLVDREQKIIGAADGGHRRLDVPRNVPDIQDQTTGWRGVAPVAAGDVTAYGVVDGGRAVCLLGRAELPTA